MEKEIQTIDEALDVLKQGEILIARIFQHFTYFKYQKNGIIVMDEKKFLKISELDFLSLYQNNKFFVFQKEQSTFIDSSIDEQYYNWKHK